ncbi:MAG: dienelactone hydrolase family protein [Alphaproteobacteria bacterium]
MRAVIFALLVIFAATPAQAKLVTKDITYKDGDTELTGHFAYDDAAKAPMPGVVVVHEWWGNNDYSKHRAEQLAGLGYAALAIDMYGSGKMAANPDEAGKMSKPFYDDRSLMLRRAQAGLKTLTEQPEVDKTRLGVIGYCFGGAVALEMARRGEDVKGVVSFHGNLSSPEAAEAGRVKAQVLVLNGGDDKFVSQQERDNFAKEMTAAGVTYRTVDYPGATHAFTNPAATETGKKFKLPIEYNESADKQSWDEMKKFFERLLAEKPATR